MCVFVVLSAGLGFGLAVGGRMELVFCFRFFFFF